MSNELSAVLEGEVFEIDSEVTKYSEKFSKKAVVLHVVKQVNDRTFDNYFQIEFTNSLTSKLDGINVGDKCKITCNVQGNKWAKSETENLFFTKLVGWKVEGHISSGAAPVEETHGELPPSVPPAPDEDDLPF